ncbi:response regulator transcription factor [Pseudonocardia sp. MH-G8]|uniref:response regulator n=1 Tax=Pseudonocardia sp. MH-G8 TaxID=1854588 RepID=UPI002101C863|nr:response regulator transcription factor [Pseudonocardia sp. MH-G8]
MTAPRVAPQAPLRVLLADDQEMVRTGFRLILSAEDGVEVVGEAGTGVDAVTLARELRPDVVLMDIRMPLLDGLEATRALTADPEPPRIVVVTTFDLDEYVYGALRAGACGFLLKDAGPRLLVEAVRAAAAGDALVSPSVTVRLLEHLAARPAVATPALPDPLSPRELEVVRAVARGRTNAEIAAELFVSLSTVKTHLTNVQAKLSARNRVEIAAWAWEHGHVR